MDVVGAGRAFLVRTAQPSASKSGIRPRRRASAWSSGGNIRASTTSPFTSIIQAMGLRAKRSLRQKSGVELAGVQCVADEAGLVGECALRDAARRAELVCGQVRRQGRIVEEIDLPDGVDDGGSP